MDFSKNIEYGVLNDYYGSLLTPYQSKILYLYYDLDSSLAELADEYKISRQGIRDVIVRASKKLLQYEEKLGLLKKRAGIIKAIDDIINTVTPIIDVKTKDALLEIKKQVEEI